MLLAAAAAALCAGVADGGAPGRAARAAQSTCETFPGCRGGALCRPLSPQPTFDHEVVAYHADGAYGANGSEYAAYGASSSRRPEPCPTYPAPLTPQPHSHPHSPPLPY